jgi:hypothetical protein
MKRTTKKYKMLTRSTPIVDSPAEARAVHGGNIMKTKHDTVKNTISNVREPDRSGSVQIPRTLPGAGLSPPNHRRKLPGRGHRFVVVH